MSNEDCISLAEPPDEGDEGDEEGEGPHLGLTCQWQSPRELYLPAGAPSTPPHCILVPGK